MKMRSRFLPYGIYFNIVLLLLVVVLSCVGIHAFRDILLSNARVTGMTLASNYASEERSNLVVYETLLSFGTASIDTRLLEGDAQYMMHWMGIYFDRLQTLLGRDIVRPYIVLNGQYVGMEGSQQSSIFRVPPEEHDWFKMAVKEPGKTVFTGVYDDAVTGSPIITVARKCRMSDAVLAFDIFPDKFQLTVFPQGEKRKHSFFLCDAVGTVLYKHTALNVEEEVLYNYLKDIISKIQEGYFNSYSSYIVDFDGRRRAVYYARMPNGWYSIVTVPHSEILKEADFILLLLLLATGAFLIEGVN